MPRRRAFGSVYRRRRTDRDQDGTRRPGHYPGWYVRYRRKGKEVARYAGPNRKIAEAYLRRLHDRVIRQELLGEYTPVDITFDNFAQEYHAYSQREHSPPTARTRRWMVDSKLLPFFRGRRLADITRQDVDRVLADNAHLSPASRNRILSAVSVMFQRAIELGYVVDNPAKGVRRAREHATPLPLVSVEEQMQLLAALPPKRRTLFLALLDTGTRLGELLGLQWRDVEHETRSLLLRRTKNHRPRVVRMSRRVAAAIEALRSGSTDAMDRVFEEARASDGSLRWCWRRSFKTAAASAGHQSLRIHDLRHLAAINLVRAGIDLPTIQAHLGHRKLASTLRYAAYADRTASARAAEALDELFRQAEGDLHDGEATP